MCNELNRKDLTDDEKTTIERLRSEAEEVKDCFTKFSFQAIGLSAALYGLILRLQVNTPIVSLASLLVIGLMLMIVRVGIHKYETANRLYGFQLHIERRRYFQKTDGGWTPEMRDVGWEEAAYAWRVIQPGIYRKLYRKYDYLIPTLRTKKFEDAASWVRPISAQSITTKLPFNWFMTTLKLWKPWKNEIERNIDQKNLFLRLDNRKPQSVKAEDQSRYFEAGSYLRKTFNVLHLMCLFGVAIMFTSAIRIYFDGSLVDLSIEGPLIFFCGLLSSIFVIVRIFRIKVKREILEAEIGSINTCAIIWHAVVVAHYRAKTETVKKRPDFDGYSLNLLSEKEKVLDNLGDLYVYIRPNYDARAD